MLATHSNIPTKCHLVRLPSYKYIDTSDDHVIHYKPKVVNSQIYYADINHDVHYDGKGHGYIIAKVGTGMIVTLSSTESESGWHYARQLLWLNGLVIF